MGILEEDLEGGAGLREIVRFRHLRPEVVAEGKPPVSPGDEEA
jgi:hypothetical protein